MSTRNVNSARINGVRRYSKKIDEKAAKREEMQQIINDRKRLDRTLAALSILGAAAVGIATSILGKNSKGADAAAQALGDAAGSAAQKAGDAVESAAHKAGEAIKSTVNKTGSAAQDGAGGIKPIEVPKDKSGVITPKVTTAPAPKGGSKAGATDVSIVPEPSSLINAVDTSEPIDVPKPTVIPGAKPKVTDRTVPTPAPTSAPVVKPTAAPTPAPTSAPVAKPTAAPTSAPTPAPVAKPSSAPTQVPSSAPIAAKPTSAPTSIPTAVPSVAPQEAETIAKPKGKGQLHDTETPQQGDKKPKVSNDNKTKAQRKIKKAKEAQKKALAQAQNADFTPITVSYADSKVYEALKGLDEKTFEAFDDKTIETLVEYAQHSPEAEAQILSRLSAIDEFTPEELKALMQPTLKTGEKDPIIHWLIGDFEARPEGESYWLKTLHKAVSNNETPKGSSILDSLASASPKPIESEYSKKCARLGELGVFKKDTPVSVGPAFVFTRMDSEKLEKFPDSLFAFAMTDVHANPATARMIQKMEQEFTADELGTIFSTQKGEEFVMNWFKSQEIYDQKGLDPMIAGLKSLLKTGDIAESVSEMTTGAEAIAKKADEAAQIVSGQVQKNAENILAQAGDLDDPLTRGVVQQAAGAQKLAGEALFAASEAGETLTFRNEKFNGLVQKLYDTGLYSPKDFDPRVKAAFDALPDEYIEVFEEAEVQKLLWYMTFDAKMKEGLVKKLPLLPTTFTPEEFKHAYSTRYRIQDEDAWAYVNRWLTDITTDETDEYFVETAKSIISKGTQKVAENVNAAGDALQEAPKKGGIKGFFQGIFKKK